MGDEDDTSACMCIHIRIVQMCCVECIKCKCVSCQGSMRTRMIWTLTQADPTY